MNRAKTRLAALVLSAAAIATVTGCAGASNNSATPTPTASTPAVATPSAWTQNVPTVTTDASGKPVITLPPGVPAPTELMLTVLKQGDGEVVKAGDSVTVDYQGVRWDTGEVFDQSYGKKATTFSTAQVIPGFQSALVGQKVGSQVMVVMPPELAYGPAGGSNPLSGQTLVFLIDIRDTKHS